MLYFEEGYQHQLKCELAIDYVAKIFSYSTSAKGKLLAGSLNALRRFEIVLALTRNDYFATKNAVFDVQVC